MRKLASFALPFSAAVFGAQYLLPRWLWLPVGVLCALFALLGLPFSGNRRLRLMLIALGLAAGLLWCRGYDAVFYAPAEELDGRTVILSATVADWPRETDYGVSVLVFVHTDGRPDTSTLLYADARYSTLIPGDTISVIAACRLSQRTKSGEEITYYTSKGVFLTATAYGEMTVTSPGRVPLRHWPQTVSKALKESVAAVFPADTVPLATALITGEKTGLDDSVSAGLRRAGLAHVVVVSGMHISFLAGMLMVLPGKRRRRTWAVIAIVVIFFFAAVAGNTPSVLRAAFLCACMQLAPLMGRESDTPTALSAVLAALLVQNPHAAANIGLQLSFAAVAGIYLFTAPLYQRLTKQLPERKVPAAALRFLAGTLATTLGAVILTTPLAAYYFGTVSLIAPLANLLALWAVTAAFIGGLAAALLGLALPIAGTAVAVIVAIPLRYLLLLVPALGRLPFAAVTLRSVYYALWLLFVYAVLCLYLLWRGEKKRPVLPLCACTAVLCAAIFFTNSTFTTRSLVVSVLDVGQGQSIALHSGSYAVLVDCGGNACDNAGDVAADYLQNLGRTSLDLLVLTHYHADHAGGVAQLMERLDVKAVALPDVEPGDALRLNVEALAKREGAQMWYITENDQIIMGEATLTLYAPLGGQGENELGLSVLCTAGAFDVLITGDMSDQIEARLVKYNRLPDIELLIAGHHGSKYATSETLLDAVTPETAVISVGDNTYGHPTDEVLTRLAQDNIAVYRTDLSGTVTIAIP